MKNKTFTVKETSALLDGKHVWVEHHRLQALRQGWDLFEGDDGIFRIQALDDPESVAKDFKLIISPVSNTDEALAKVLTGAVAGDMTCLLALYKHGTMNDWAFDLFHKTLQS